MTSREKVIRALLNAEKKQDLVPYLQLALKEIDINPKTAHVTIASTFNAMPLLQTYTGIEFVNEKSKPNLYFTNDPQEIDKKDPRVITFSTYDQTHHAQIELGLQRQGVFIHHIQVDHKETSLFPRIIAYTENLQVLQHFLEIVCETYALSKKKEQIELYLPSSIHDTDLLSHITFPYYENVNLFVKDKASGDFQSIPLQRNEDSDFIASVYLIDDDELPALVECSEQDMLIDGNANERWIIFQSIIDTLSNFHSKRIWTSKPIKGLDTFTNTKTVKKLYMYQYKTKLPDITITQKELLDRIITLGAIQHEINDILDLIMSHKSIATILEELKQEHV